MGFRRSKVGDWREIERIRMQDQRKQEQIKQQIADRFVYGCEPVFFNWLEQYPIETLDSRTVEILKQDAQVWLESYNGFSDRNTGKEIQEWLNENYAEMVLRCKAFLEQS